MERVSSNFPWWPPEDGKWITIWIHLRNLIVILSLPLTMRS
jgi:hypothetical protein